MISASFAAGLLVLSLVKATDSACSSSQASFIVDNNPLKGNKYFLSKDVSSAAECAAICFDHPFCLSAGFNPSESGKLSCLLSYVKTRCSAGEAEVTTYSGNTPVLLRCMTCAGSTFAPVGSEAATTVNPAVTGGAGGVATTESGNTAAASTAAGSTAADSTAAGSTAAGSTVESGNTGAASTAAGSTEAGTTAAVSTGAEAGVTGGAAGTTAAPAVEIKLGEQREFPGSLSGGAEIKSGKCRYKRFPGVNVKHGDSPGFTTGVGTISSLNLTESSCAQICGDHPYCDYAIYKEAPSADGTVQSKYCELLTPPLQFYKDVASEQKLPGYVEVFLDDIECAEQPYPGCSFESKLTTLGSFDRSLLAEVDVFNTRSGEFCAGQCFISPTCDTALFELNAAQCYFLNNTVAKQIESSGASNLPTIDSSKDRFSDTFNYYLLKNTKCDAEFLHNFKRQQPGFSCDRPGTDDSTKRVVKVADVDPTDALSGHNVYANYTAILRSPDVTVDACQFTCAADPRCDLIFFATSPEGAKLLQTAAGFGGAPAKCVMYQYDQLVVSDADGNGRSKYIFADKNVKTKPNSGVTQYTEVSSCNGQETYPPDCLAKSVRGNFKPSETGEGVGGYPVLGPDECDHLCTSIGGCKASFFHTVSTGDDLCYLVQSENPKGFTASPTGDGFLRSDFVCGNITGPAGSPDAAGVAATTAGPAGTTEAAGVTSGVGLITGAAEGTTAAGNASNIDANPITKGVETVTNATVAGVQPGETVTNATATTAGPVVEGVTNASATTGGLEGVTHVEVAVNSTAATAEAKPVEGSTNAAATTAQPNFTGVESSQNSTGTTDVKPTGDASNSTAPEGHLGVANATTTGAGKSSGAETVFGDQSKYPGGISGGVKTAMGNCTATRYSGVLIKTGEPVGSVPSVPPTNLGYATGDDSHLDEARCAQLCYENLQCDSAIYREGKKDGKISRFCGFLAPPLQFFKPTENPNDPTGSVFAFLDDIQCGEKPSPTCHFEGKLFSKLGSVSLNSIDFINSRSADTCVASCAIHPACESGLYDLNNALCYLLTAEEVAKINNEGARGTVNEKESTFKASENNYYLLENGKCDDKFMQGQTRPKADVVCDRSGTDDSQYRVRKTPDVDIKSVLTGHKVFPNFTEVIRSDISADLCQYLCVADSRCDIIFYATNAEAQKSLGEAVKIDDGKPPKCVSFQYTISATDGKSNAPVNLLYGEASPKTSPGSGITQYSEISSCNGVVSQPPNCKAKTIRGKYEVVRDESELVQQYIVMGPDDCDHICASTTDCKSALFQSVESGDDLCRIFTSDAPKGFSVDENGNLLLRSQLSCGTPVKK